MRKCPNCGAHMKSLKNRDRCTACTRYMKTHSVERPAYRFRAGELCKNGCGRRLPTISGSGLCETCQREQRAKQVKKERGPRVVRCDCTAEAVYFNVKVQMEGRTEEYNLCASCFEAEFGKEGR